MITNKTNLEPLANCPLFRGMAAEDLETLAPLFSEKELTEGTTVFVENMPGESLYLIRQGTIQISRMMAEGQERTLVVLGPEDAFGEMALLDGGGRTATARVAEKASLLSIRKSDFEALCEKNSQTALRLLRNIVRMFSQRVRDNANDYRDMLIWSLGGRG